MIWQMAKPVALCWFAIPAMVYCEKKCGRRAPSLVQLRVEPGRSSPQLDVGDALARLRADAVSLTQPPPVITELSEAAMEELTALILDDVHEVLPLLGTDASLIIDASTTRPWQSLIGIDLETIETPTNVNTTTTTTPVNATNASLTDAAPQSTWDAFVSASTSESTLMILGPAATCFVLLLLVAMLLFCCVVRGPKTRQEAAFLEQPGHDEMHECWVRPHSDQPHSGR